MIRRLSFPNLVYIEAEVVEPGPKANFEPDHRTNRPMGLTMGFDNFMESKSNVLLLSGPSGSGKSTAFSKLRMWVLGQYTEKRKEEVSQ